MNVPAFEGPQRSQPGDAELLSIYKNLLSLNDKIEEVADQLDSIMVQIESLLPPYGSEPESGLSAEGNRNLPWCIRDWAGHTHHGERE